MEGANKNNKALCDRTFFQINPSDNIFYRDREYTINNLKKNAVESNDFFNRCLIERNMQKSQQSQQSQISQLSSRPIHPKHESLESRRFFNPTDSQKSYVNPFIGSVDREYIPTRSHNGQEQQMKKFAETMQESSSIPKHEVESELGILGNMDEIYGKYPPELKVKHKSKKKKHKKKHKKK
jgi:hypothetical protein